jgi:hypothetical protein
MEWLHLLPSVRVNQKSRLPECPGIYLFSVGRSIYYVGKALNIRERHSSESNHDAYSNFYKTDPNLRKLFCIKWLPFTGIAISGYLLDQLLLGYEDYLIKNLCPPWNKRQNGTEFSDDLIHLISNEIMNTHFSESAEPTLNSSASIYPAHQSIDQECKQLTYSDEFLAKIKECHATRKKSVYKHNNGDWANLKDNTKIQDLFLSLNAYSDKPISPADMVSLGFKLIAQHLNSKGLVLETDEDFSILENFLPETQRHPKLLLVVAKASLEMHPNMSFEGLVLRCTAKSVEEISPLDTAMLRLIYSKCDDPINLSVDIIQ